MSSAAQRWPAIRTPTSASCAPARSRARRAALTSDAQLLDAIAPSGLPASGGSIDLSGFETATLTGESTWDSISAAVGSTITVEGDAVVHVTGDVTINHSDLVLAEGATLELYVDGDFTVTRAANFGSAAQAGDASVFVTGGSAEVSVGSAVGALVAAPYGAVEVNHSDLTGGISANEVTLTRAANITADAAWICE